MFPEIKLWLGLLVDLPVKARADSARHLHHEASVFKNLEQVLLRDLAASSFQLRKEQRDVNGSVHKEAPCGQHAKRDANARVRARRWVLRQARALTLE